MAKGDKKATRAAYGKALADLGEKYDFVVMDADLSGSTQTAVFAKKYPKRFFNCGIAEQNMISVAAGIATTGVPVFASSFAMFAVGRAYEQIRNSVGPIVPVASLSLVVHCMASAYTSSLTTGPRAEQLLRLVNGLANWCASSRTHCWRPILAHPWLSWATSTMTLWTRVSPSRSVPSVSRARQVPTTFTILGGTRS